MKSITQQKCLSCPNSSRFIQESSLTLSCLFNRFFFVFVTVEGSIGVFFPSILYIVQDKKRKPHNFSVWIFSFTIQNIVIYLSKERNYYAIIVVNARTNPYRIVHSFVCIILLFDLQLDLLLLPFPLTLEKSIFTSFETNQQLLCAIIKTTKLEFHTIRYEKTHEYVSWEWESSMRQQKGSLSLY